MNIAVLFVLLILAVVLIVLRRNVKWGVYIVGTSEIMFRLFHRIGDNIGIEELNELINKVFPTSLFDVAATYTSGLLYTILFWLIIIILVWFLVYLIKYLFKAK